MIADILVLGAARQDLVADDQHRRGDKFWTGAHGGHANPLKPGRTPSVAPPATQVAAAVAARETPPACGYSPTI